MWTMKIFKKTAPKIFEMRNTFSIFVHMILTRHEFVSKQVANNQSWRKLNSIKQ